MGIAANRAGFSIHLVDHDYPGFDFSSDLLAEALEESSTAAVVATHLFGTKSDVNLVKGLAGQKGVLVIEDAAQVFREETDTGVSGEEGDFGIYSLSPSKPLTLVSGGILWTREESRRHFESDAPPCCAGFRDFVMQVAYKFGTHSYLYPLAWKSYFSSLGSPGENVDISSRSLSRLKERFLAAALEKYPRIKAGRREKFRLYDKFIASRPDFTAIPNPSLAYYVRPVLIRDPGLKETVKRRFREHGLEAMAMDWKPLFHHDFLDIANRGEGFENASRLDAELILLPTGEAVTEQKLDRILGALG